MTKKKIKYLFILISFILILFLIINNRIYIMGKLNKSSITILDDNEEVIYKSDKKLLYNEEVYIEDSDIADSIVTNVIKDIKRKFNYSDKKAVSFLNSKEIIIYSTISSDIQEKINVIFDNKKSFVEGNPQLFNQAAMIIMDYEGNVKGVRGGNNNDTSINRASTKLLQVGSTIKPVSIYSLAIENNIVNFSTIIDDIPRNIVYNGETIVWPTNYNDLYESNVTITDALKKSKNTIAVNVGLIIGEEKIFNFLKDKLYYETLYDSNVEDDDRQLSALALGYFKEGITLDTLVSSYSIFGNEGYYKGKRYYKNIRDEQGKIIIESDTIKEEVISYETASIMNRLLLNNIEDDDSIIKNMKNEKYEILGKTGTVSDDNNNVISNLFVGMTPSYVGGVWIGYDDKRPMIYGTYKNATSIWKSVFDNIDENKSDFNISEDILKLEYCTKTGLLKTDNCEESKFGYYKKDNIPETCNYKH